MSDYLGDLVSRLGHWGYVILFAAAVADSAALLGLIVPGEAVVLIAGFLARRGMLDLDALILTVTIGVTLGDSFGYGVGRRLGRPWAASLGHSLGLTAARLGQAHVLLAKQARKAVFVARFIGIARTAVPFIAGAERMRYPVFLAFNFLAAALWTVVVTVVGYGLGSVVERWAGTATAIVAGATLVFLALGWLWHWTARHEARAKNLWARVAQHLRVADILERFAAQSAWLRARLSPGSYFGLQLTVGVLVFVGAAWLFGGIAEDVVTRDLLTVFDLQVEHWFRSHQEPWLTTFLSVVSRSHEWPGVTAATALFLLHLLWQRQWRWVVTLICAVPGGMLLNTLLKLVFHRARPTLSDLAAVLHSYSFPSGHVMAATLLYATAAAYLATRLPPWRWHVLAALVALSLIATVAFSRVYLGVHFLSDVLAAAAAGVAWFAFCQVAVNTLWHRRGRNH
jgi:membrane protein DedA with SNARE-associated domain/membrane-associated phospholipid phosphatase